MLNKRVSISMSQIERLSNISLAEEPNFQANVSAPVKNVRGNGKNYTIDDTYLTVEEAKEVLTMALKEPIL